MQLVEGIMAWFSFLFVQAAVVQMKQHCQQGEVMLFHHLLGRELPWPSIAMLINNCLSWNIIISSSQRSLYSYKTYHFQFSVCNTNF